MSSSVFVMTPVRFLLAAVAVGFGVGVLRADDPPVVPPNKGGGELDLTQFPGQVVDEVIVPVPSEIFAVLDKLGDPDWKAQVATPGRPGFTERTDVALLLGATVADGFIGVQAEDRKTVENIGREVLALATALGLREDVLKHCQAIDDAAKGSKWEAVRSELDATQATDVIMKAYSGERAELLLQPDLADYFNDALEEMLTRARNAEKLKAIADGVARLREIMQSGDDTLSEKAVREMHGITAGLVKSITTKG